MHCSIKVIQIYFTFYQNFRNGKTALHYALESVVEMKDPDKFNQSMIERIVKGK